MTLCIAAVTGWEDDEGRNPAIVVASDFKASDAVATAENQQKLKFICNDKWVVLMSGTGARARELIRVCDNHFAKTPTNEKDILNVIKQPVALQKKSLIEE